MMAHILVQLDNDERGDVVAALEYLADTMIEADTGDPDINAQNYAWADRLRALKARIEQEAA